MGNDKAPGLSAEGFYRYSVVPASLDATNHHPNLLVQRFIFRLRDRLEPFRVLAVSASPYDLLRADFAGSNALSGCVDRYTRHSNGSNKGWAEQLLFGGLSTAELPM